MKIFETIKLEDLVSRVKVGFVGSINDFYCDSLEGVPLIRTTDLSDIDLGKLKFVTKEFHLKNKKSQVKKGDLIVARHGDNGFAVVFDEDYSAQVLNAVIIETDINKLSPYLLKLFLESPFVIKQIKGAVKGSVQGVINTQHIADLMLPFNKKINYAGIEQLIFFIDKKIEVNNRINAELEAMAKILYDYWFVQFEFPFDFAQGKPTANGNPYKTSGGKMVYNPILKREIPEGWEAVRLNELFFNRSDSISSADVSSDMPYTPIDFLPMKKMSFGTAQLASKANTSLIKYQQNDILIGAMRVYFHRVCIAPFDGISRTTIMVLKPKFPEYLPYLYQVCNEERTISFATKISTGTQQPYVNWDNALENLVIPFPLNCTVIEMYSSTVACAVKDIISREKENDQLVRLRDWLLPMLMNGQITVK